MFDKRQIESKECEFQTSGSAEIWGKVLEFSKVCSVKDHGVQGQSGGMLVFH